MGEIGSRGTEAAVSRERFIEGMGQAATGVTVVTTDGPAGRQGATVSAMCSVSADPPSLLVCIYGQGRTARAIVENGVFCVNLLGEPHGLLAELFARRAEAEPFAASSWTSLETGAPALDGAVAIFDCRLANMFEHGTHGIFVGSVVEVAVGRGLPLVYADRNFCRTLPLSAVAGTAR
jgi:flavin reductase